MASSGKPKTTRAKLQREAVLRERRLEKAARKEVRKQAHLDPPQPDWFEPEAPEAGVDALEAGARAPEAGVDAYASEPGPAASV